MQSHYLQLVKGGGAEIHAVLLLPQWTKSFLSNSSPREQARQRTEVNPEGAITIGNDRKMMVVLPLKQEVKSFVKSYTYLEASL